MKQIIITAEKNMHSKWPIFSLYMNFRIAFKIVIKYLLI